MTLQTTFTRVVNLALGALLLGGGGEGNNLCCVPFPCILGVAPPSEGLPAYNLRLHIFDLASKHLPIVQDADFADPKAVKLLRKKQKTFEKGVFDRQLVVRAKQDDAATKLTYDRPFRGDHSVTLVLEMADEPTALVDGASLAFLEMGNTPLAGTEGVAGFLRVSSTWDAGAGGLVFAASDASGPLGDPATFAGATGAMLIVEWRDTARTLQAFPIYPEDIEGPAEGLFQFFYEDALPLPDAEFLVSFGVEGLGASAEVTFDELQYESSNPWSGSGEAAPALAAALAVNLLEQAVVFGEIGADPALIEARLDQALPLLDLARTWLDDAKAGETIDTGAEGTVQLTLHPSTQVKLADRSLKQATKRSTKGAKLATKLVDKGSTKTGKLTKRVNRALWSGLLLQAQLFGFSSKHIDHYFDTLSVTATIN